MILRCRGREIPRVDARELIFRNVARYIRTGKYIPVDIVAGYVQRAEQLLANSNGGDPTELAKIAGFTLLDTGLVRPARLTQATRPLGDSHSDTENVDTEEGEGRGSTASSASSAQSDSGVQRTAADIPNRKVWKRRYRRPRSRSPHSHRRR